MLKELNKKFNKVTSSNKLGIQKVCHLHNGTFHLIQLCQTLLILLYHFPFVIP